MIRLSVATIQLLVETGDVNAQSALRTYDQIKTKREALINFDKNCIYEFKTYMKKAK